MRNARHNIQSTCQTYTSGTFPQLCPIVQRKFRVIYSVHCTLYIERIQDKCYQLLAPLPMLRHKAVQCSTKMCKKNQPKMKGKVFSSQRSVQQRRKNVAKQYRVHIIVYIIVYISQLETAYMTRGWVRLFCVEICPLYILYISSVSIYSVQPNSQNT